MASEFKIWITAAGKIFGGEILDDSGHDHVAKPCCFTSSGVASACLPNQKTTDTVKFDEYGVIMDGVMNSSTKGKYDTWVGTLSS